MGILQTTLALIHQKAETKDDGCYRIRGVAYRVRDHQVTHVGSMGELYQFCHGFMTTVGTYEYSIGHDVIAQALLKEI